ncbi:MAG: hypothetical protein F4Y89_10235 [Gammaproteobacteria bacterium]|nr:hypothetical protein [Gammaproteobacteria bacterium]MYG96581.1 hypothetical protein [Gammaproteobacteria bacterium]
MTQQYSPETPAPGSGNGASDYQLYIRTKQVEQAWPVIPDWPLSSRLGPLLVSFEITLKILQESLDEAAQRLYLNSGQKCEAVVVCLNLQLRLLTEFGSRETMGRENMGHPSKSMGHPSRSSRETVGVPSSPSSIPEGIHGPASKESVWGDVMRKLARMSQGERLCEELNLRYQALVEALGFDLGLAGTAGFDYDKWIKPAQVHNLYTPDRRNDYPEDALFVRVHQVCEGLLEAMHVELRDAEQALYQVDYLAAESRVLMSARFARALDTVLGLLGEMSQTEYAPLRLAQRDINISQSPRWQAGKSIVKDHFWLFIQQLKNYGLDPFLVMVNHREHVVEHRLLQAFKRLSRTMQESLSNHFLLMQNIQGSAEVGNIDPDALSLESPGATPLLPELVKAFDKLTLWTSLKHVGRTGAVMRELEEEHGLAGKYEREPPTEPSTRSRMLRTIDRYFETLREGDRDAWIALFSDPPYLEDPKGSSPAVSRQELDLRFRNLRNLFPRIDSCEYQILVEGENSLQVQWTIAGASFLEDIPASATRDQIFHFDPNGHIRMTIADWNPEALADQLLDQHREAMLDAIGQID